MLQCGGYYYHYSTAHTPSLAASGCYYSIKVRSCQSTHVQMLQPVHYAAASSIVRRRFYCYYSNDTTVLPPYSPAATASARVLPPPL
eukprot:172385-Pyramimonas_sp.AAC.1